MLRLRAQSLIEYAVLIVVVIAVIVVAVALLGPVIETLIKTSVNNVGNL